MMHVSGLPNVSVIAGSGMFNAAHTEYTFQVDKGAGSNNGSSYTLTIDSGAFSDSTGHTNAAKTTTNLKPAGTSGEAINLALTDPSHDGQAITVTVKDVPSGWTINGATHNADGSWTVQTNAVHELTVTTPADFTGAAVLDVLMSWTNADGTLGSMSIADNVEAYAPGSPVFAWSGDDVLTGSSGNDLFVFSQPIGNDTVHSFDAAADQIDLIGYSGFQSFADVQAHMADDANGNAVITLGDGQSILLDGVHSSALTDGNFVFDQTPVVNNAGTMTIGDGALMPLSGTINNSGLISLDSTGSGTLLQLIQHGTLCRARTDHALRQRLERDLGHDDRCHPDQCRQYDLRRWPVGWRFPVPEQPGHDCRHRLPRFGHRHGRQHHRQLGNAGGDGLGRPDDHRRARQFRTDLGQWRQRHDWR
ncbi:hypothetical protein AJ88_26805 [Mesorhizobium amorphae CCBAU 01583]|nr:hypothetical protein AJ88_26805 [Mesorhizobium amorphae CCBAU 01583]